MVSGNVVAEYLGEALDHICNCELGKQFSDLGIVETAELLGLLADALTEEMIRSDLAVRRAAIPRPCKARAH